MSANAHEFNEEITLEHIRHYLSSQAALKDFIHHNTLHAFQDTPFHEALEKASDAFGYSVYLSLDEFRRYYSNGRIRRDILDQTIRRHFDSDSDFDVWKNRVLHNVYDGEITRRIGQFRKIWKEVYQLNPDKMVHTLLFRLLASYMDQGISIWRYPFRYHGFLDSIRELEQNKFISLFKSVRVRKLLFKNVTISDLLKILVGNPEWYEHYLFDLLFSHPGWSGFVSVVETHPETLLSKRKISLKEVIILELLLEIDVLDNKYGLSWPCLSEKYSKPLLPLFGQEVNKEVFTVLRLWQEAYEWSYFDGVLSGISRVRQKKETTDKSFQALFCIDDRAYSFRRQVEIADNLCETFGTPGFFGVEFYFQPEFGRFYTKACPAPMNPKYLIKEFGRKRLHKKDPVFNNLSHSFFGGWLISSTTVFWMFFKLIIGLFKPSVSPATAFSFSHMDKHSWLQIDSTGETEDSLNIGFTNEEMAERVKQVLNSIGLMENFAPVIYVVGHGASSVNNPYYAGYDCGACCGRPGAVNARVFAYMANKEDVRLILKESGINIPDETIFIGAMQDTTRDEIEFYDDTITKAHTFRLHQENKKVFEVALSKNAFERSYRFDSISRRLSLKNIHNKMRNRSVSLFEPRPEWNHADNALCIIGRKILYDGMYLDKRPFINSYDYRYDPDGNLLLNILKATLPVCGGINLEYYFSRVDQQNLGAGTKLPQNVVGLFAVNNGVDGDLRPGLPSQMIEIHDPVRLLFIIEQLPEVVLRVIQSQPSVYEWVQNEWVLLCVTHPVTRNIYRFHQGGFEPYIPLYNNLKMSQGEQDVLPVIHKKEPVLLIG